MKIKVIKAKRLTPDHLSAWSDVQRDNPTVDNPFFRPEFISAVATLRDDIEVAVMEEHGEYVGFLPFQRDRRNIGRAAAWRLSELHGLVIGRDVEWDALQLLSETGLSNWNFMCVPAAQKPFQPYHFCQRDFPYMDLNQGFEVYRKERRQAGSVLISQALRKARKIEREMGPLRFVAHTTDRNAFAALMAWKSAQYKRLGIIDLFSLKWVVEVLEMIRLMETEFFSGMLSALYLGDRIIAVHLGIRSKDVLGWWYPAFDQTYEKYSPGLIFLTKLAEAAPGMGIKRIDLGPGPEQYKSSFKSGAFPVAEGSLNRRPVNRMFRRRLMHTREWVNSSPLQGAPLRWFRYLRNWGIRLTDQGSPKIT